MDDTEVDAGTLADEFQRFSAFLGLTKPDPRNVFILVLGRTGSGKSTFISRCTGKDATVGHGLHSCKIILGNERRVYLVDTPGFNDTNRPDIDTLRILATYLSASYVNGVRIHGIVFLHPISDNRMSGAAVRNIRMIKAVCGFSSYENLAITTTMWPEETSYVEAKSLEDRENDMMTNDRYFGDLVAEGATVFRHGQTDCRDPSKRLASAQDVTNHLVARLERRAPEVLRLQREMVDEKKSLGETAAGNAVAEDLEKARTACKKELIGLEASIKSRLAAVNTAYASQLQEQKSDIEKRFKVVDHSRRVLKKSMRDLHKQEERAVRQRVENADRSFRAQITEKEKKIKNMEKSLFEQREETCKDEAQGYQETRRQGQGQKQPERQRQYQTGTRGQQLLNSHRSVRSKTGEGEDRGSMLSDMKEIEELKRGLLKSQGAYEKFHGQTGNLWNGTMNGVAAGVASGVIGIVSAAACTVM
ncbi:hypothetical protein NCS52_00775600 [Fusarium sp. LHS14.1]|nr:hypothetical protein NCS52_00775600 [Fusarium sp. LHS14.1]